MNALRRAAYMASPVAIVFIHSGNNDYLRHSLAQARRSNPKSPVYLIGDEATAGRYADAEHIHFRNYVTRARQFAEHYRHLNTNTDSFELFCMMRWFVLLDFMSRQGIDTATYLDSDIMLYEEMHYEHFRYYDYDLAVTGVAPPVLINNRTALEAFCTLMEHSYRDPYKLNSLEERFQTMQAQGLPGGICDMTFWELFIAESGFRIADLSHVTECAVYDRNIFLSDGFDMENGMKKVSWKDRRPFGHQGDARNPVRFKGLHFHGPAKSLMAEFLAPEAEPLS